MKYICGVNCKLNCSKHSTACGPLRVWFFLCCLTSYYIPAVSISTRSLSYKEIALFELMLYSVFLPSYGSVCILDYIIRRGVLPHSTWFEARNSSRTIWYSIEQAVQHFLFIMLTWKVRRAAKATMEHGSSFSRLFHALMTNK